MATCNITIKTKNNISAKDVIDEIGLDGYGKKYKYLFKTYESENYKINSWTSNSTVVSEIENEINTMLMTGEWKIKSIDVVTIGPNHVSYVYNVLYEYVETQSGIIE